MGISFFKLPRIRQFEYRPRYYDEEKERREQRRRELGLSSQSENQTYAAGDMIRSGAMRARHDSFSRQVQLQRRRSNRLLLLLIIVLAFVAYMMMREFSDEIVQVFFKH